MWLLSVTSIYHQNNPKATWRCCYLLASSFISLRDVTRYTTCHKIKWDIQTTYWQENIELGLPGRKQRKRTRLQLLFLTDVYLNKFVLQASWRGRLRLKCDGTRAETRLRLSAKRTSPLKSAGASVQSTTGNRGVRIGGSNAGYTMFRGSLKSTGYPLHSPVSPSLPLPCVTVCNHISTRLYY